MGAVIRDTPMSANVNRLEADAPTTPPLQPSRPKVASPRGSRPQKQRSFEEAVVVEDSEACELVGPTLLGQRKWLGAAVVGGGIFGVPGHAQSVLAIDPRLDRVTTLGEGAVNKRGINRFKCIG